MQWTTKKGKRWKEENVRGNNDKRPQQHTWQNDSGDGGSGMGWKKER